MADAVALGADGLLAAPYVEALGVIALHLQGQPQRVRRQRRQVRGTLAQLVDVELVAGPAQLLPLALLGLDLAKLDDRPVARAATPDRQVGVLDAQVALHARRD